jgi:hypothetical protein
MQTLVEVIFNYTDCWRQTPIRAKLALIRTGRKEKQFIGTRRIPLVRIGEALRSYRSKVDLGPHLTTNKLKALNRQHSTHFAGRTCFFFWQNHAFNIQSSPQVYLLSKGELIRDSKILKNMIALYVVHSISIKLWCRIWFYLCYSNWIIHCPEQLLHIDFYKNHKINVKVDIKSWLT